MASARRHNTGRRCTKLAVAQGPRALRPAGAAVWMGQSGGGSRVRGGGGGVAGGRLWSPQSARR